jgi:hypothetical protein
VTIATSKNLTISGIAGIVLLVAAAAVAIFDGDPATNVDWQTTLTGIWLGITSILAKGAQNTGGTVVAPPVP